MVVIRNGDEVKPAPTVTMVGTKAGDPVVHRYTFNPPAGAGSVSVTVPIPVRPPPRVGERTETDKSVGAGVTLIVVVVLKPL